MSLTYVGMATAVISGTDPASVSVAVNVTGRAANDLAIMVVVQRTSGTKTVTTPAGWTAIPNASGFGGVGAFAFKTGPLRVSAFMRTIPATSLASVVVTLPGVEANSLALAQVFTFRADPMNGYDVAGSNGVDTTPGTPHSAVMNVDPGFDVGDIAFMAAGSPDFSTSYSLETITATGLACALTELNELSLATGAAVRAVIAQGPVTAGPSTSVPTVSAAAAVTNTNVAGPMIAIRIREIINSHVRMMS